MFHKKLSFTSLLFITFVLILTLCEPGYTQAEELKRIALLPFDIYSDTDVSHLRESIYRALSEELTKTKVFTVVEKSKVSQTVKGRIIDERNDIQLGKELEAHYLVRGSLSKIGDTLSVDATIINIMQGTRFPGLYAYGKGKESISSIAARLKTEILLRISPESKIAQVTFKGNRKIEKSAIQQVVKSAKGNIYSDTILSADIKAIYKMGFFDDVAADVESSPEGKIITFILKEKPLITEIHIKGNKALDKGEIEGALTFKVRQTLNPEKLASSVQKIKELYDSKGYYNAEITYAVEKAGENDIRIVFTIKEGDRLYIKTISFEGNRTFTDKELKSTMSTSEWGIFSFLTDSGILKQDQLKQDISKVHAYYLNHGFINAQVGEPQITHDKKWIYVKIPIVEGKRFKVGKVTITGDPVSKSQEELLKNLKINKKEYYERASVIKDVEYLSQVCNDDGYAYADVTPLTTPQEKDQKVDIVYQIKKGQQVYFNRITITGNTKTRDKVIRRTLSIVEGDLYSSSKLKKSYMDLNRLRYFEEINFQTERGPDESLTDITIQVKEKPTGILSIGAGYSALEGALFIATISQQNLMGRGQILSLQASMGSKSTKYNLSFIEPWLFDIPLWSKFDLYHFTREYDSYDVDSDGFGVTLGYPLWEYITGYIGYRLNTNNVKNIKETASKWIKEQEGETTTSTVSVTLTRDTTDDYIFPSKGSKNTVSVDYTGGIFQGDTSFTRYGAISSWFFPMPMETVFAARGRIGYLQEREGKKAPVYERFYLGGINSLRGLRSVGPKDPGTNDVIGGLTMLNFNVEFIFNLIKNAGMKGVVFYDTGNAWESGYHFGDMRKTAGAGIRWYSPIGPLRIEWGYVLDRKADEPPSRWEFTIGMLM